MIQIFISFFSIAQNFSGIDRDIENVKQIIKNLQKSSYHKNWECSSKRTNPWHHKNIWNAYNTLEALINYSLETGYTTYINVINNFAENKCAFDDSKYAGYDDAQWTGIALLKAYSLGHNKIYLSRSIEMWNYIIKNSWGEDFCNGGLWWNIDKTYKNAITNELFIVFSTMLYFETNEDKYKNWALKVWQWFDQTKMISENTDDSFIKKLVNDGVKKNCSNNGAAIWTYSQGVLIGGLVNLWSIFGNEDYLNTAINIANASLSYLTVEGILVEKPEHGIVLENLNSDQQQFKGIFVRYLANLINVLPDSNPHKTKFEKFIKLNYKNVLLLYSNLNIGKLWNKNIEHKNLNAISQTAGLDLFIAKLKIGY